MSFRERIETGKLIEELEQRIKFKDQQIERYKQENLKLKDKIEQLKDMI